MTFHVQYLLKLFKLEIKYHSPVYVGVNMIIRLPILILVMFSTV